jgi:hypothetical protein
MKPKLALILYPNTNGIGFVVCESEKNIIDFGLKPINRRTQKEYLAKAKWLIDYATPDIILLLDYKGAVTKISKHQESILNDITEYAKDHGLSIRHYSRRQIKEVFSDFKATSKHEIAMTLIRWYPQLGSREPHKRLAYMSEHYQMGVFDAFALMITHYYLS